MDTWTATLSDRCGDKMEEVPEQHTDSAAETLMATDLLHGLFTAQLLQFN